jgi:membrane fusion protein (multidrug efflux system)
VYPNLEEKTRTLKVQALVPNHDRILRPGLFARVTLYTGPARNIVVVPDTALLYEESTVRVFIIDGRQAHVRKVNIGAKYGDLMEIVEGLKENEIVVTVGQNNLAEGAKVNVAR